MFNRNHIRVILSEHLFSDLKTLQIRFQFLLNSESEFLPVDENVLFLNSSIRDSSFISNNKTPGNIPETNEDTPEAFSNLPRTLNFCIKYSNPLKEVKYEANNNENKKVSLPKLWDTTFLKVALKIQQ